MKVAFFSSGLAYRLGGPSFSEALLIRELRKTIDVTIFVPTGSADLDFIDDYELSNVHIYDPKRIQKLEKEIKQVDLIHLNGHWKWWYANISKLAVANKIPYLLHPRGMLLVGHRKKQIKKVFNFAIGNSIVQNAEKVIALSEYEKRQFKPYRISDEKIVVIPNPIEVKENLENSKPDLPKGVQSYFIYLGRIERRKNLVFLIHAYNRYKTLGGKSKLLILGPVEHGYDVEIRQAVRESKLEQDVMILPPAYSNERDKYLKNAEALVYPATDESFGRVPFESLAVGTAPIVPDLSGAAEYLGNHLPECIFKENDETDLAKTLMRVESIDSYRVDQAKKWVLDYLNSAEITKKVLKVYESVLIASDRFPRLQESAPPLSYQKPH